MGFTIRDEEELRSESVAAKKEMKNVSKTEGKQFYTFLQKLNLRTEMGME